jgi:hypothetical protein
VSITDENAYALYMYIPGTCFAKPNPCQKVFEVESAGYLFFGFGDVL